MKRVSGSARATALAWVAVLSLLSGQCLAPSATADEPEPALAGSDSSPVEKPAEKPEPTPAEQPEAPAPKPEPPDPPAEQPDPPGPALPEDAAEQPDPPVDPSSDDAPAELPPSGTRAAPPSTDGSPIDPESPRAPEPGDPAMPAPDPLLAGPDESLAWDGIEPMAISPDDLFAIGTEGYPTLDAAISAAGSGQTIATLKSVTHSSPVVINGKDLAFDLSEGSISIDTGAIPGSTALTVRNATVTLTGGGYLDARGVSTGVHADNASITVRYATAGSGTGAYAEGGGRITVRGDAKGYAIGAFAHGSGSVVTVDDDALATGHSARAAEAMANGHVTAKNALSDGVSSVGAAASSGGTVTVIQQATGTGVGARASGSGRITVGGKVTASGSGGIAAWADTGGSITIDGELAGATYVRVGSVDKGAHEAEPLTTLAGYRTYLDGTSTVWVKGAPLADNVCAIGDREFPTLDEALAAADGTMADPTVIRLLRSIDHDKQLDIGGRHVVFDLGDFDLMVDGGAGTGLLVVGGTVGYAGRGDFVVSGAERVVEVNTGGAAAVTGIRITGPYSSGAYAGGDGARVVVNGEIRTTAVHDSVIGAYAEGEGARVVVSGGIRITGGNTYGARSYGGGRVTVESAGSAAIAVTGDYAVGASPRYGGEVMVTGDIAASGEDAAGVAAPGGIAHVSGDVTVSGAWSVGAASSDGGDVVIDGQVGVTGAKATGLRAHLGEGSGGRIRVTGTVTVAGDDALGAEAYTRLGASPASLIVIDGQLNAPEYLLVDDVARAVDSKDDTEPSGHWLYLGRYGSLVKIRNGQPVLGPPVVVTKTVTGITGTGADLAGEVTSDGGATVGERGFVYSTSPDPTLAAGTRLRVGSGMGEYGARLSGLAAGTTYHVRAYATNSEATSYGASETFVTQGEPSPEPTPTPTPDPAEPPDPAPEDSASDAEELPVTGTGDGLGWLLGVMATALLGGMLLLHLKGRAPRGGGR